MFTDSFKEIQENSKYTHSLIWARWFEEILLEEDNYIVGLTRRKVVKLKANLLNGLLCSSYQVLHSNLLNVVMELAHP